MTTNAARYRIKASDIKPGWHLIDAEGKTLGRLASEIAVLLMGKHKPTYVRNLNTGDFVIVTNADKISVTGNKLQQKRYYRHSGYHGGLTEKNLEGLLKTFPTRALERAVKGMLPKNKLGRRMLSRLKLYAGAEHRHEAQLNAGARVARAEAAALKRAEAKPDPTKPRAAPKAKRASVRVKKDEAVPSDEVDAVETTPKTPKKATTTRKSKPQTRGSSTKTGRASSTRKARRGSRSADEPADSGTEDA